MTILRNLPYMRRHLITVSALGLLFLAVSISGFVAIFTATNNVENQRSQRLAQAALTAQINMLAVMANDYTEWDDAANEVYDSGHAQSYFHANWADYTSNNKNYDLIALLDEQHRSLSATEYGKAIEFDPKQKFGAPANMLLKQLSLEQPSAQILIKNNKGLAILAAAIVRHTDRELSKRLIGSKPRILLFRRQLPQSVISALASDYNVSGLRFQQWSDGKNSVPVKGPDDAILGYLAWDAPSAGFTSAQNALPVLLIGSLLFFIALSRGARMGSDLIRSLSDQAFTDSLSGMPNRRALKSALSAEQRAKVPHALALIDLDGFKYVNDNFGHPVGDQLIKKIAVILTEQVGSHGMVARLGGDEFAILTSGIDADVKIEAMMQQFLERLRLPIMVDERALAIGASVGLAGTQSTLQDESELMRRADIAMYQAKHFGKMRIEWYRPFLDDERSASALLAEDLRHALTRNELTVVYQPIVNVSDSRFSTVEALARWTSPTRGVVDPDLFIPVAENTGLIDSIGLFVLRRACTEIAHWSSVNLAVNVSAAQLRNPMFPHQLKAILDETGFAPSRLELEITETYLVSDAILARKVIDDVVALGIAISLDDFGTGYASIGFLRQFPFAKLKIDQSLVKGAQTDDAARMLVQVSVAAARALKMKVVAEGVETNAQADLMRIAGCDQLQGWHFSRPLEHTDLAELLEMQQRLSAKHQTVTEQPNLGNFVAP
jgi:diguanylate cyclase (GGDEF)-like protein